MLSLDGRRKQKSTDPQNAFIPAPVSTIRGLSGEPVAFPLYRTLPVRVPSPDEAPWRAATYRFPVYAMPFERHYPTTVPHTSKKTPTMLSPTMGRRTVVHMAVSILLLFIIFGVLIAVLPVGTDANDINPFWSIVHRIVSQRNATDLVAAQVATATAVTADGYDPGGHQLYADVQSRPSSSTKSFSTSDEDSENRFFYGQCTYWSNARYHQLTSHWVPWLGDAYQWAYDAPAYGWTISAQPNPDGPSIVVLAPYAQGSGRFGHVAVVENAVTSASHGVLTSSWNWNGHWATLNWVRFYPGPGVSFLWYHSS